VLCRSEDLAFGETDNKGQVLKITYVNGSDKGINAPTPAQASLGAKGNPIVERDQGKILKAINDSLMYKKTVTVNYKACYPPDKTFKRRMRLAPFSDNTCLFFVSNQ
jgi:hypothetical protein